jgi:RHS repeat-associated protein
VNPAAKTETVPPLAAFFQLTEKPHLGHPLPTAALYPGVTLAISNTASGLHAFLYDSDRRSRSTGKERDAESGLDYFGARYFSGPQGRFTSADEPFADQHPGNPQSWNLYAYTLNNPLSYTDPTGQACVQGDDGKYHDDNSGGQSCADVTQADKQVTPSLTVTANSYGSTYAFDYQGKYIQGSFRPPTAKETAIRGDTVNMFMNLSVAGDGLKLGVVLGAAGKDAIAALNAMRGGILYGSTFDKAIEGGVQMVRSGGAAQAAADFDAVVSASGAQVRTYGTVKSATLADGSEVTLRTSTTKGFQGIPTLQFRDQVGEFDVKIRY